MLEVGPGVSGFAVGDKVACGGAGYASHAEIVSVPRNLCVKLPPEADLKAAAYNTLGAIALQGIRQADLRLGEACAVIGLGLLGQLTCLMLRASGVQARGFDVDAAAVETARRHACDAACSAASRGWSTGCCADRRARLRRGDHHGGEREPRPGEFRRKGGAEEGAGGGGRGRSDRV